MQEILMIFLFGPMGAGKDTVAEYLEKRYGFLSIAMADGMRQYISANLPNYVWKSNRSLEIDVGEKHREWFGKDFWCRYAENIIKSSTDVLDLPGVIIRDGRFDWEYEYFVNRRGYVPIKVISDDEIRKERLIYRDGKFEPHHFNNPNDCPIINYSAHNLNNNGNVNLLYKDIDALLTVIRKEAIKL